MAGGNGTKNPSEKKKTAAAAAPSSRRAPKPKSGQQPREAKSSPESFHDRLQKRFATYDPDKVDAILAAIAEGSTGTKACKDCGVAYGTLISWVRADDELGERYTQARAMQVDRMADELQDVADDGTNDFMKTEEGLVFNKEHVQRSRLRVESRKWLLSKLKPQQFGDRLDLNHSGEIAINKAPDEELNGSILALAAKLDKFGGAK